MDLIMVYLIVRGLESISFDQLFTYCDLSTRSIMVTNFTRIIVILMSESILFSEDYK